MAPSNNSSKQQKDPKGQTFPRSLLSSSSWPPLHRGPSVVLRLAQRLIQRISRGLAGFVEAHSHTREAKLQSLVQALGDERNAYGTCEMAFELEVYAGIHDRPWLCEDFLSSRGRDRPCTHPFTTTVTSASKRAKRRTCMETGPTLDSGPKFTCKHLKTHCHPNCPQSTRLTLNLIVLISSKLGELRDFADPLSGNLNVACRTLAHPRGGCRSLDARFSLSTRQRVRRVSEFP